MGALSKVFVLFHHGVRQAALIAEREPRGRKRCRVLMRGANAPESVHPSLVFKDKSAALEQWRRAREHQAELEKAGGRIRAIDAYLSLALSGRC